MYGASTVSLAASRFCKRNSAGELVAFTNSQPVAGSTAAPPHPAPPMTPGMATVPCSDGGVYSGPRRYGAISCSAACRSAGVNASTSVAVNPCVEKGAGRVGKGCVAAARSPGTSLAGTGRSSMGHNGRPVVRSKAKRNPCLVGATTMSVRRPPCVTVMRLGGAGRS
jgi:hypothetical protein